MEILYARSSTSLFNYTPTDARIKRRTILRFFKGPAWQRNKEKDWLSTKRHGHLLPQNIAVPLILARLFTHLASFSSIPGDKWVSMAKIQGGKKKWSEREVWDYLSPLRHEIYQRRDERGCHEKSGSIEEWNTNYFADHRLRCIDIVDNWGWDFKGRMAFRRIKFLVIDFFDWIELYSWKKK